MPNDDSPEQQDPRGPDQLSDDSTILEPSAPYDPIFAEPRAGESILGEPEGEAPAAGQPVQTAATVGAPARPADAEEAPVKQRTTLKAPDWVSALSGSGDIGQVAATLEQAARFILLAAIFLTPIVFDPRTSDAFNLAKMTTLWVLGLLAAAAWLFSARLSRGALLPRSRVVLAALVLLGITALATLIGPNRTLSFHGLYHRYEGLASIAIYIGILLMLVALYRRRPGALSEVAVAVGASGGVVGAYAVLQRLGLDPFQWQELAGGAPTFPIGNLGNSSFTAAYLGIAVVFVLYLVLSSKLPAVRLIWGGIGVLMLTGLLLTQGRAGIIAAILGCAAFLLFMSRVSAARKVVLIAATLFLLALAPFFVGDPTDRAEEGLFRTGTASYRSEVWGASWRMTLSRPTLGWGPESFFGEYGQFRSPADARRLGLSLTDKPHNIYLSWSASTGFIGLGIFLFIVGSALLLVGRASGGDRSRRLLVAGFGAGLVAYLVQGMYSIDVPPLALMAWIALAGIVVLADRREGDAEGEQAGAAPRPSRAKGIFARPWFAGAAIAAVTLVLIGLGMGPLRADYAVRSAQRRSGQGWSTETMNLYEKAISLDPREAAYRGLAGAYLEAVSDDPSAPFSEATGLKRAGDYYEQASDLQPRNVYFMINAARVYSKLGPDDEDYFERADELLGRVVTLDPIDPQTHDLYKDLLGQWAKEVDDDDRSDDLEQRARAQASIASRLRAGEVVR